MYMPIDQAIKKIRWELRLSQQALAKAVGCTQTTISSYEVGERKPRYDVLKRIDTYARKIISELNYYEHTFLCFICDGSMQLYLQHGGWHRSTAAVL